MTTITSEIPKQIKDKFDIWEKITYNNLISKTIWKEFCSTDLDFTPYNKIKETHKEEYNKLEHVDKSKLLNI